MFWKWFSTENKFAIKWYEKLENIEHNLQTTKYKIVLKKKIFDPEIMKKYFGWGQF